VLIDYTALPANILNIYVTTILFCQIFISYILVKWIKSNFKNQTNTEMLEQSSIGFCEQCAIV